MQFNIIQKSSSVTAKYRSSNTQTSFRFNMLHCIVPSLMPHNSSKAACVEYVHDLFYYCLQIL